MRKEYREDMTWRANYRDKMKEARHFPSFIHILETKGQEGLTDKSLEPRDEAAVKRREMREEQGMRKR